MLKLGEKIISDIYLGNKKIAKVFLGDKLVYQSGKPIFLDYIKSTGTQYIDTGIKGTDITRFVVKGTCLPDGQNNSQFLGGTQSSAYTFFGARYRTAEMKTNWYCMNSTGDSLGDPSHLSIIEATIESKTSQYGTLTDLVDGSVKEFVKFSTSQWGFPNENLLLFGGDSQRRSPNATCYMLQLYTKDGLVRDLRPCIDPKGVVCMYDMVTKKYYYNQGTGTLTAGNIIKFVDYIENTSGAYIDTGLKPSYDYTYKIKYQYTNLSKTFNPIFGMRTSAVGTGNNLFWAGMHYTYKQAYLRFGGNSVNHTLGDKALDVIEMTCSPEGIFINGEDTGARYFDGEITPEAKPVYLFTINNQYGADGGLGETNAKVYSYQVFDGDVNLIQDLRPCIVAGEACFYDMVTGKIFTNAGTGTLGYTE